MNLLILIAIAAAILFAFVFLSASKQLSDSEEEWPDNHLTGLLKEDRRQNETLRRLINAGNALSKSLLVDLESRPTKRRSNAILIIPRRWHESVVSFQSGQPTKQAALNEMIKQGAFIAKLMSHDQKHSAQWDQSVHAIKGSNGQSIHLS